MTIETTEAAPRWGTRVVQGIVAGHECKVYEQRPRSVAELLVDAQRWAERDFIVQGARRITGAQHAHAVARVARMLREHGVRTRDPVVLLGYNHIEWLVTFWALQALGATAVLGNAWWSDTETTTVLETVRPTLVISDRARERFGPGDAGFISFSELRPFVEAGEELPLDLTPVDEEWPAWVIFSSGTTGHAKGVVMSHRSVIANIQNVLTLTGRLPSELPPSHRGTVSLVSMPLFHLAGIQISLMSMLSGGKLVFLAGKFDPLEVLRLMERERVRSWGSVPTMVSRVIQHPDFGKYDTSSVSSVQMGGAAVPHALRLEVQQAFPNTRRRVGSMYGLTEAGGVLAAGSGDDLEGKPGCVGKPLPSVEIVIRNPDAQGVGEIAARAPSATSGYLGDPTPIADADGWVLTGDLGRFDDAGYLYIVGRSKDTIIRGGENIASVHVESVLRTHPDVLDVAVVPLPDADLGEEVAAAVVLRHGAAISSEDLRAYASRELGKFEVPSRWWLRHDPLPTNASGKTIKREVIARWPANEATGVMQ
ncbi:AMP-binding enzyme family protein [Paraburkholderia xenovorans LB400]|uniref:AMP-dependent synthetase and ligase n=1 Tax=Paraburkholderia xenovorans (strain LB400) TaxID=266265 RepID=Q13GX5_PARXL|nr:Putative AMP-dependent synthetase and ligase [Paraburkholderia xenovorans LB400]AIP34395.1 AMP-binding enzyme family protein [Paraburkholderia xenovorans LB400]